MIAKRMGALVSLVGALALLVAVGPAASASESTTHLNVVGPDGEINQSCGPQINVFNTSGDHVRYPITLGDGSTVNLSAGTDATYGTTYWAHITHSTQGDEVWMDWSDSPGSWHQCGPFTVDGSQGAHDRWTWGVNLVANRYFRACGFDGVVSCTPWRTG